MLRQTDCILFADDTTVYISGDDINLMYSVMNEELDNLSDWFRANKLSLNVSKTNCVLFNKSSIPIAQQQKLSIDGKIIERVDHTKFLGIYIDQNLSWQVHIDYCRKKIASGVYALNSRVSL